MLHSAWAVVRLGHPPKLLVPGPVSLGLTLLSQVELLVQLFGKVAMAALGKDGAAGVERHA